jgi:hypothetical protein
MRARSSSNRRGSITPGKVLQGTAPALSNGEFGLHQQCAWLLAIKNKRLYIRSLGTGTGDANQ